MSHKYRSYPAGPQVDHLLAHCRDAAVVFNLAVEQQEFHDRYRRSTNYVPFPSSVDLAEARAVSFLGAGSSSVQQQALRDYAAAIMRWSKACDTARQKGRRCPGRPSFRRQKDGQGFVIRDVKVQKLNRHWSQVQVPKHDEHGKATWIRFSLSRPLPPKYTTVRVTLDRDGRWFVSFTAPPKVLDREQTGSIVGIDRGVANSIATSDGEFDHAPTLSPGEQAWHVKAQQRFSAAPPRSAERAKWKACRARSYAKLADRRNDWIEQTTTRLVREHDVIVVEDLNIIGMVHSAKGTVDKPGRNVAAKSGLNRAILAQCWGKFLQRLKQKAELAGVLVIEVPARNTSRRCHECGHTSPANRESQAVFVCVDCGHQAHADTNAARNIRERGWTSLRATRQVAA